jgi:hypothetical protein
MKPVKYKSTRSLLTGMFLLLFILASASPSRTEDIEEVKDLLAEIKGLAKTLMRSAGQGVPQAGFQGNPQGVAQAPAQYDEDGDGLVQPNVQSFAPQQLAPGSAFPQQRLAGSGVAQQLAPGSAFPQQRLLTPGSAVPQRTVVAPGAAVAAGAQAGAAVAGGAQALAPGAAVAGGAQAGAAVASGAQALAPGAVRPASGQAANLLAPSPTVDILGSLSSILPTGSGINGLLPSFTPAVSLPPSHASTASFIYAFLVLLI